MREGLPTSNGYTIIKEELKWPEEAYHLKIFTAIHQHSLEEELELVVIMWIVLSNREKSKLRKEVAVTMNIRWSYNVLDLMLSGNMVLEHRPWPPLTILSLITRYYKDTEWEMAEALGPQVKVLWIHNFLEISFQRSMMPEIWVEAPIAED